MNNELKRWRKKAYKGWLKNRFKTEFSINPIKRFKYCLHEWRWNAYRTKISWVRNTIYWCKIYVGFLK